MITWRCIAPDGMFKTFGTLISKNVGSSCSTWLTFVFLGVKINAVGGILASNCLCLYLLDNVVALERHCHLVVGVF